jgi:phosphoribosylglycinamide formyltransferase-1
MKQQKTVKQLAIFASGAGSNAKKIIEYFSGSETAKVGLIACNKPGAGVVNIAHEHKIPVLFIEKERFFNGDAYLPELQEAKIDLIILAGFLWKIPAALINVYPAKIINIHPALLPKYGGKGMYGEKVYEAVLHSGDEESGITIHLVDEEYDNGQIIFQALCGVSKEDTAASLAKKIHALEHANYPRVIEQYIKGMNERNKIEL